MQKSVKQEEEKITDEIKSLIIDAALDAIVCIDTQGFITVWNKQAEKIFGWSQEEAMGRPIDETIIPKQFQEDHQRGLMRFVQTGNGEMIERTIEVLAVNRKGKEFPVEITITSLIQNGFQFFCAFIRDITEKKKAREEIVSVNERFKLITKATNDVAWDWNLITDEMFWNENYFALFGYDPEETPPTAESWYRGIHRDDKAKILTEIHESIEGHQQFWSGEYRFLKADGTVLHVYDRGFIQYEGTKAVRMVGAMMDISERKKAEARLIESENQLRAIIQTEPECIKLISCDFKLLEMNPAGLAMIEADHIDQVRDHSVMSLVKPEHRTAFTDAVKDVFNGNAATMKFEITGLKGSERWIDTHMVPMRNADGAIISLLAVARDITEQKKSEESLRQAEERYRQIFENTLDGIYQSTPDGQFITVNPAMAKIFGFDSPEDMISSVTDIGTQFYADPQERLRMKHLLEQQGQANGFELRAVKKNNEEIWVRDNIRAINDEKGKLKYYEGTIEDITERKLAEEKLKAQFDEIQKTNYELDRFVYSVSHDLRAPLASILGIINVAKLEGVSAAVKEYLEMIRTSVNRLDMFIRDILNYSRNARMEVRLERVNFRQLLEETQTNLKLIEGAERLQISIGIHDPFPFYSDSARIGIVLNNLFSNSIKYQDRSKPSSLVQVSIFTDPEKATITLKDNGIGIAKDHLDKIFNMFYRASDVSKGSGLGLYIAKETITKLGGSMTVSSEFGSFTSFEIQIPNGRPSA